jgi:hypothetical protein
MIGTASYEIELLLGRQRAELGAMLVLAAALALALVLVG